MEKMQSYILAAKNREKARSESLQNLHIEGLQAARSAAQMLRQKFGVTRVVLFGSMRDRNIHENSDIDLAVWGLPESDYFKAVGKLQGLGKFQFDLVEPQNASSYIRDAISRGIEL
jgi:uncharacterized protein